MRRLCLSGFRLVAPPFAVHDAHNQGERQQVVTFIANNLAVFQQRVSAVLEASQREQGKYIEFDETCHHSRSYQNVMINFHRMASSTSWTTSHCHWLCHWLENVFYRNIRQWPSNGHLVTVEANRHLLPNLLRNCGKHRQEVTYTTWLINDDDVLTASTVTHCDTASHWHWPNRFTTGRARGRNWPVLENSCKNIMGLVMCTW